MGNLEQLIYHFIKEFPQKLGRTMLAKAIYLLDCEWYKSFGVTYSGLEYKRDNNGPFDTSIYEGIEQLESENIIKEKHYIFPGGHGYEFELLTDEEIETGINPIASYIADGIVESLSNKGLQSFKDMAYNTEPMIEVLYKEKGIAGEKLKGRQLDMSKLKRTPDPLFNIEEIKEVAKTLDMSKRGSDGEYNETILEEMNELEIYRERVSKACQIIGEE